MTALAAVFGPAARDASVVRSMLDAMGRRGAEHTDVWSGEDVAIGVARDAWESAPALGGTARVWRDGDLALVADAALYYTGDLAAALRASGIHRVDDAPGARILAAYRAWGERCPERLEGDFAFVLWDARRRRALCARDFSGKRPLVYAALGESLLVASTADGALAHPQCPSALDEIALAEVAGGLPGASDRTGYRAVARLSAGTTLAWGGGSPQLTRHWFPPPIAPTDRTSFDDAAAELRSLLSRAVGERMRGIEHATVWMSGGWDSTAVFGAGRDALGGRAGGAALRPVSVSYPPGDPGREDELIDAVARRWEAAVEWLDIADIPFFDRPVERAAARAEPFAHAYEMWLRALARGTRRCEARVAFDGVGGDQLFQVTPVYLADLLRAGRWFSLAREWKRSGAAAGGSGAFLRWAVHPALPESVWRIVGRARGRPIAGYLERPRAPWLTDRLAAAVGADGATRGAPDPPRTPSAREMYWYLTHPYFPFVFGCVTSIALEEGVELRSPLYDARVIAFAARRPREERSNGRETKRLLRHAMRGLVPEEVLAPRPRRTGIISGYFRRSMREAMPALLADVLASSVLAELGIIDRERLRRAGDRYIQGGDETLGVSLFLTVQTELWTRARVSLFDRPRGVMHAS